LPRLACRHASTRIVSSLADLQCLRTSGAHAARSCRVPCFDYGRTGEIANARKTALAMATLQIMLPSPCSNASAPTRVDLCGLSERKVSTILTRRHKDVCALVSTSSASLQKTALGRLGKRVGVPPLGCGVSKHVSRIGSLVRRRVYVSAEAPTRLCARRDTPSAAHSICLLKHEAFFKPPMCCTLSTERGGDRGSAAQPSSPYAFLEWLLHHFT
jgi:hypothetical protein